MSGHVDVDDAVHCGRHERQLEFEMPEVEGELDELGVDRVVAARDDRDVIKAVGPPHLLELRL